jgi:hypothetical protein
MSNPDYSDKPKSRFEVYAPKCPKCHFDMKLRSVVMGKREDLVGYSCENCEKFANRLVPHEQ